MDEQFLNQYVTNKIGEKGQIVEITDTFILVKFDDRSAKYERSAFEKGFLKFVDKKVEARRAIQNVQVSSNEELRDAMNELEKLKGLNNIKEQINDIVAQTKVETIREAFGLKNPDTTRHLVFIGNSGTGKTTVARIIAKIYKALGVLSKGHFIETDRTGLVAAYQGQTGIKTREILNKAQGGVLFIDEAYSLHRDDKDDYGQEAIDILTKSIEDSRADLVVIVAGYKDEMDTFFKANPGLASRFKTFIAFDDYESTELFEIFDSLFNNNDYVLDESARNAALSYFNDVKTLKANARDVRNMFEDTIKKHSRRISDFLDMSKEDLMVIKKEDLAF